MSEKKGTEPRPPDLITEIKKLMGDQLISSIYRDRIRTGRTRSYQINAPAKRADTEIMHTLLGIELKIGKKRMMCPDLSTARYLAVFARLGVTEVAIPYNITQISKLADDLESSWYKMLMLAEHLTSERTERIRRRVISELIKDQCQEVIALGSGPAVPQFNQNTKQRRLKT
ncbi:MAG: hypothetical protein J2P41_10095 [Blastocatellia bacterium]|nr:hypothetical protein [Blastocatellia bacterium]